MLTCIAGRSDLTVCFMAGWIIRGSQMPVGSESGSAPLLNLIGHLKKKWLVEVSYGEEEPNLKFQKWHDLDSPQRWPASPGGLTSAEPRPRLGECFEFWLKVRRPASWRGPSIRSPRRAHLRGDKREKKLSAGWGGQVPLYSPHYYRGNNVSAVAGGHSS